MDADLRQLERAARSGDCEARSQLDVARARAGMRPWWWESLAELVGDAAPREWPLPLSLAAVRLVDMAPMDPWEVDTHLADLTVAGAWWDAPFGPQAPRNKDEGGARWLVEVGLLDRWEALGCPGRDPRRDPLPGDKVAHRFVRAGGQKVGNVVWGVWIGSEVPNDIWRWAGAMETELAAQRDFAWGGPDRSSSCRLSSWRRWAKGRRVLRRIGKVRS